MNKRKTRKINKKIKKTRKKGGSVQSVRSLIDDALNDAKKLLPRQNKINDYELLTNKYKTLLQNTINENPDKIFENFQENIEFLDKQIYYYTKISTTAKSKNEIRRNLSIYENYNHLKTMLKKILIKEYHEKNNLLQTLITRTVLENRLPNENIDNILNYV